MIVGGRTLKLKHFSDEETNHDQASIHGLGVYKQTMINQDNITSNVFGVSPSWQNNGQGWTQYNVHACSVYRTTKDTVHGVCLPLLLPISVDSSVGGSTPFSSSSCI